MSRRTHYREDYEQDDDYDEDVRRGSKKPYHVKEKKLKEKYYNSEDYDNTEYNDDYDRR